MVPIVAATLPSSATIVSIGYERRSIDELVAELVGADVDVLVDVRLNAISRKKGFSKTALANGLSQVGIRYVHQRELGNPKDNREDFRRGEPAARQRYRHHLDNGAGDSYRRVVELAHESRIAVFCYEREHSECHRSCILERAQRENPDVTIVQI